MLSSKKNIFLMGLMSSLAFAPFFLFPIFFISFNYLLKKLEKTKNNKESFFIGWLFGFGYFIGNCYWYCHSLLMWPYYFLIPFAITIIPAFLACYTGLTTLFTKKIYTKYNLNKFLITIVFALLWTILEYLRGIIFTGFPWNLLCYSLGFSSLLIQTIDIYGCYVFTFFLITIFTYFYVKSKNIYINLYYILLILFILIYGFIKNNNNTSNFDNFLLIKTDIPVITTKSDDEIVDYLINLTLKHNIENIDYIIWPEAVIPQLIKNNSKVIKYISNQLQNKTLITGAVRLDKGKIYNSLIVIKDGKIIDYYDKYKLVPFGEYIPFRKIISFIPAIATTLDISKGEEKNKLITLDNNLKFTTMICYESIFPSLVNKKADLIINITNDSWFGKTSGPYQHLTALKFRAVENKIPAFRISNTGITAIINSNGKITKVFN